MPGPPLRIGLVSPYSLTIPGGVQGQVMGLARELRARGIEARVLGPCDGAPPATFVTPLGDSLPTAANGSIAPIAPDASAALRTIRALRDEQFDVLHIHEPLTPGPSLTALVMNTAPALGTFHAAGDSASYRYLNAPLRWLVDELDHRVAVSKDARELAERYFGGDYEVLYNGVELERYRRVAPHPGGEQAIFFCGRHEPRKGLDVLLRAHASLGPEVRLWIASDGPDTERLHQQYAGDNRIEWIGRISDEDKVARLRGAAIFCAPSLHGESFGVVLIEAMAAGTAVVASSLDGYRNVATDGVDAVLVPPGDEHALLAALQRVLSDRAFAARLVDGASARAAEFSMRDLAEKYVERYEELRLRPPRVEPSAGSRAVQRLRRMMSG
ncbi:MAG: glycosyltransferase family 4 protein [Ilumatobacteraceae bacterium]